MICAKDLTKVFGSHRAVDSLSFEVKTGDVLGFMGPNGAGKSTTMKMLTCFIPPTSGTAEVGGFDIRKNPLQVREQLGYLPESSSCYEEMLVEEFLKFIAEVRGFSGADLRVRVDRALDLTSLHDVKDQMIETLSKGYRQRTCLAQALLHDPSILILDEPTDGLDPNQKHEVRNLIKQLSEKRTILVSTHILEEIEAVCSRALIIAQGKLVADGTPEELLARSAYHNAVTLKVSGEQLDTLQTSLEQVQDVDAVKVIDSVENQRQFQIFPKNGKLIQDQLHSVIGASNVHVEQFRTEQGRLDEVFRKLTLASN